MLDFWLIHNFMKKQNTKGPVEKQVFWSSYPIYYLFGTDTNLFCGHYKSLCIY